MDRKNTGNNNTAENFPIHTINDSIPPASYHRAIRWEMNSGAKHIAPKIEKLINTMNSLTKVFIEPPIGLKTNGQDAQPIAHHCTYRQTIP